MKQLLALAAILGGGLFAVNNTANAVLIDSFSDPGPPTFVSEFGSPATIVTTSAIGGQREVTVVGDSSIAIFNSSGTASLDLNPSSVSTVESISIVWDGGSSLGNVDLTEGGALGGLAIRAFSIATAVLAVTLDDGVNSDTQLTSTISGPFATYVIPLGSFVGVDETSIDSITLTFSSAPGLGGNGEDASVQVQFLETVPEPTSIALLGMGAFGLMGYGWRRKKKVIAE